MKNDRITRNGFIAPEQCDPDLWPAVDVSSLSEEIRRDYENRARAIRMYLSHVPIATIESDCDIHRSQFYQLLQKCLAVHPDGRIWGFRALPPYTRVKTYVRVAEVGKGQGASGAFHQLLARHQDLRELITAYVLKQRKTILVHESRIPIKSLHKRFLDQCQALGIPPTRYPFTHENLGKQALANYVHQLIRDNPRAAAAARHGENIARLLDDTGSGVMPATQRIYECVQFDGHRLDVIATVRVRVPSGGYVRKVIHRIWILVIIEVRSRAILGYSLCFRDEYSQDDVAHCIKNSLMPWSPKNLTIPNLSYDEGAGMPSRVIPQLAMMCWDIFHYDNALANLSNITVDRLTQQMGCAVKAGPVGHPTRRAIVERFFKTLEECGLQRLPSTTGSNPKDSKRDKPEEAAVKFDIRLEELEELIDVIIANYNCTPQEGIHFRSPLQYLRECIAEESFDVA